MPRVKCVKYPVVEIILSVLRHIISKRIAPIFPFTCKPVQSLQQLQQFTRLKWELARSPQVNASHYIFSCMKVFLRDVLGSYPKTKPRVDRYQKLFPWSRRITFGYTTYNEVLPSTNSFRTSPTRLFLIVTAMFNWVCVSVMWRMAFPSNHFWSIDWSWMKIIRSGVTASLNRNRPF